MSLHSLLENGANTSFIHQIADPAMALPRIVADPALSLEHAVAPVRLPSALFADRQNAAGLDLADDAVRAAIVARIADDRAAARASEPLDDPPSAVAQAVSHAHAAFAQWRRADAAARAAILERAADLFEAHRLELVSLVVREGYRTIPDALSELREAVDFLRKLRAEPS